MSVKHWIQAFRLRTLPLAISAIGLGGILAYANGRFSVEIALLSALTAILLQVLSNLANDYGDFVKGTDDETRTDRSMASGLISKRQMQIALVAFSIFSLCSGLYLLFRAFGEFGNLFLTFLVFGLLSIVAAIAYTVGKRAYGYSGLGDLAVLIFFGWLAVSGSMVLHMGSWDGFVHSLFVSTAFGLLSTGVLNINNIRDIKGDLKNSKITLAVSLGRKKAELYQLFLYITAFILAGVFLFLNSEILFSYYLLLPLYLWHWIKMKSLTDGDRPAYNKSLKQLVFLNILWVLIFSTVVW